MSNTNNSKVKYLIDPTIKKSGPDFSAAIADFGDGHMQQGVTNLWEDGKQTGFSEGVVVTVVVTVAVTGVCILIQKAVHKHRIKQAIATLLDEPDENVDKHIPTATVDKGEAPQTVVEQSEHSE